MKLIMLAVAAGIPESQLETFLKENNISDYNFDNLKVRLGIEEKKP